MNLGFHEPQRPEARMSRRVLRGFSPAAFAKARGTLSPEDLYRLTGVGVSTIYSWEKGTRTPTVDILAKVMQVLNASIGDVVLIAPDDRYPGDWRTIETGLTQPGLAAAAGIPTSTLQRIERASLPLSDSNAKTLSAALGIPVEEYRASYERARLREPGTPA